MLLLVAAAIALAAPPYTVVLGIAQDGGHPHAGCERSCCARAWKEGGHSVTSLGIVDPDSGERWLVEATPDFPAQLHTLQNLPPAARRPGVDGIVVTHGHIGHYSGLMHLGREVMGASEVPVYAMPRMRTLLEGSAPWSLLVRLENIAHRALEDGVRVALNERLALTPFEVPHRGEFTETVGLRIEGPSRSVAFVPDVDKWERWDRPIEEVIAAVDVAYLDGTFYAAKEIPGRSMADIPHPFVLESLERFAPLPEAERAKVRFIHLNHTNPILDAASVAHRVVHEYGFRVAVEGERVEL